MADCAMGCPVTFGKILFVIGIIECILITLIEIFIIKDLITLQKPKNEKKTKTSIIIFIIFAVSIFLHRISIFIWFFPSTPNPYAFENFGMILNGITCPIAYIGYCIYFVMILKLNFPTELLEKKRFQEIYVIFFFTLNLLWSLLVLFWKIFHDIDFPFFIMGIIIFYWIGQPALVILEIFIPVMFLKILNKQKNPIEVIN